MKKWIGIVGLILGGALVAAAIFVLMKAHSQAMWFVYPGEDRPRAEETPAEYGLPYEDVTLMTSDGVPLAAWYVPSQNGAAVILQHGYRGNRGSVLDTAKMLAGHGYGILMMDARAHGDSGGEMVTFGLFEVNDIRAGLDYLLSRQDVDAQRIGALGESQGAVTTLLAAAQFPEIQAYIGDSPYASLEEEIATGVKEIGGLTPFPWAILIRYFAEQEVGLNADLVAPIRHIAEINPRPVLLLQGGQDNLIPADTGQRLYEAAGEAKSLWYEETVGHTDFLASMPQVYEQRIINFFNQYLLDQ